METRGHPHVYGQQFGCVLGSVHSLATGMGVAASCSHRRGIWPTIQTETLEAAWHRRVSPYLDGDDSIVSTPSFHGSADFGVAMVILKP